MAPVAIDILRSRSEYLPSRKISHVRVPQIGAGHSGAEIMVLEVAILDVIPGQESDFLTSFDEARKIISSMPGHLSHELKRCIENRSRFILLVNWRSLEDHTVGFRGSSQYQEWKSLLHHYYDPFPAVEHYEDVNS